MQKTIVIDNNDYSKLSSFLGSLPEKKPFLVCDGSYGFLRVKDVFNSLPDVVSFSRFTPNPDYSSVEEAVRLYREKSCDCVIAVGGGSAIDLAKCVKAYVTMPEDSLYLEQEIKENGIPLIALPTTAGTGSEATRYAVIYYQGNKQSIAHTSLIPSTVVFDSSVLATLPEYQRKSTMLDALCHSVESFWSVNSTDESKEYSKQAIGLILDNLDSYLNNENDGNKNMLKAANIAGKAINITQTTAGHAMCYKLTSLYGIAHGHAAALCVNRLMPYMIGNTDKCVDSRGSEYLECMFAELAEIMGCADTEAMCDKFASLLKSLALKAPEASQQDIEILSDSVNPVRLKNNPVLLDKSSIETLYREILF